MSTPNFVVGFSDSLAPLKQRHTWQDLPLARGGLVQVQVQVQVRVRVQVWEWWQVLMLVLMRGWDLATSW